MNTQLIRIDAPPSRIARLVTAVVSRVFRRPWEFSDNKALLGLRRRVRFWDFSTRFLHAGWYYKFLLYRVHLGGVRTYRVHLMPRMRPPAHGRTLLYLHGGGFFLRSLNIHARLAADICGCAGFSHAYLPLYRLAPEHKAPAALDDAVAVFRALLGKGYRATDIVLAGDSAGGGLVLSTLLRLRELGLPMPAGAVLLSPVTDLTISGPSHRSNQPHDPVLGGAPFSGGNFYSGSTADNDPMISPLFGEFHGFPPLFVQVGSHERLLDDSLRLQANAARAGSRLTIEVWNRMPHVWQVLPIPERRMAIRRIGSYIRHEMTPPAPPAAKLQTGEAA